MRRTKLLLVILLLSLLVSAFAGCSRSTGGDGSKDKTIRISGAWALYPMMVKWAEEYRKLNPDIKIDISAGGAGKGVADALAGLTDIGMVSRDIRTEEMNQGAFAVAVVKDAVFPVMNADNPVAEKIRNRGIGRSSFIDLWIHGKRLTWGELAQTSSNESVQVYTRSDSCGAAETWAAFLGGKKQEDLKGIGVYGDPGLGDAVRKDLYGVGYNNLNYAFDMKSGHPLKGLSIIPIDVNGNGRIDQEEMVDTKEKALKAVMSGTYPSPPARDLYLISKGRFTGRAKDFVAWILKDGQAYVSETGYISLSPSQIANTLAKMEGK